MKKNVVALGLLVFSSSILALASNANIESWDFVAPAIFDRDTVPGKQVGLIVLDSDDGKFYGVSQDGAWVPLSNTGSGSVVTKTATDTLLSSQNTVFANSSGGNITLTLPTAVGNDGLRMSIKRIDSTIANTVTIDGNGSEEIDGSTTTTLNTENETITIVSDGSNWEILSRVYDESWNSFTPSSSWSTNTTTSGFWRRQGDSIAIQFGAELSGAPDSTNLNFDLPSGLTIDTAKIAPSTSTGNVYLGDCTIRDFSGSTYTGKVRYSDTNTILAMYGDDSAIGIGLNFVDESTPITFAADDSVQCHVIVPISGWK